MATTPPVRFSTLGPVDLRNAEGAPVGSILAQPKRVALLAFLRLARDGAPVPRGQVLETFWPDLTEERALSALRQSVHFLRRSLGAHAVERTGDHLLHVPPATLWCDAHELPRLLEKGRGEEALELYRGPFLEGLPLDGSRELEDWVDRTRRRLRDLAVVASSEEGERALAEGRPRDAVAHAEALQSLDALDERGASLLVRAHTDIGDPASARRAYDDYASLLKREIGVSPSPTLTELASASPDAPSPSASDSPPVAAAPDSPERDHEESPRSTAETASDGGTAPERVSIAAPSPRTAARRSWGRPAAAAAVTLVAGVLAVALLRDGGPTGDADALPWVDDPSVAVLPFRNLSPDTVNAFFVAGIHESLLVNLSRIGSIRVAALRAVEPYADTDLSPADIGERLGVTALMRGSVQREDDQIRLIVELSDPRTGAQIWADSYDRRVDDVFRVQSDIARRVAESLQAVLTPSEEARIARAPTESIQALDLFMRARAAYRDPTLDGMNRAIELYEEATRADPAFASAWAGLADALLQRVQFFGYPLTWADSARGLVERALALDPESPEANKTMGFVHSVHGRERAALEANEQALRFRPGYADAMNNVGWSHYYLGEIAEAGRMIESSFRLQPNEPQLRSNVGAIWAALARLDEAAEWLDGLLEDQPLMTPARTWRTFVELQRGDAAGALNRAEQYLTDEGAPTAALGRAAYAGLLARDPDRAVQYASRAMTDAPGVDVFDMRRIEAIRGTALMALGREGEARPFLRTAIEAVSRRVANGADGWDPPWEWAAAHAALGETDEALRHLGEAVERGFPHAALLRLDPAFDSIRADPRFIELTERAARHEAAERAKSLGT